MGKLSGKPVTPLLLNNSMVIEKCSSLIKGSQGTLKKVLYLRKSLALIIALDSLTSCDVMGPQ